MDGHRLVLFTGMQGSLEGRVAVSRHEASGCAAWLLARAEAVIELAHQERPGRRQR